MARRPYRIKGTENPADFGRITMPKGALLDLFPKAMKVQYSPTPQAGGPSAGAAGRLGGMFGTTSPPPPQNYPWLDPRITNAIGAFGKGMALPFVSAGKLAMATGKVLGPPVWSGYKNAVKPIAVRTATAIGAVSPAFRNYVETNPGNFWWDNRGATGSSQKNGGGKQTAQALPSPANYGMDAYGDPTVPLKKGDTRDANLSPLQKTNQEFDFLLSLFDKTNPSYSDSKISDYIDSTGITAFQAQQLKSSGMISEKTYSDLITLAQSKEKSSGPGWKDYTFTEIGDNAYRVKDTPNGPADYGGPGDKWRTVITQDEKGNWIKVTVPAGRTKHQYRREADGETDDTVKPQVGKSGFGLVNFNVSTG